MRRAQPGLRLPAGDLRLPGEGARLREALAIFRCKQEIDPALSARLLFLLRRRVARKPMG
jgi:hypothetical protein